MTLANGVTRVSVADRRQGAAFLNAGHLKVAVPGPA